MDEVEDFISLLTHADWRVRKNVAQRLGISKSAEGLDDIRWDRRLTATWALTDYMVSRGYPIIERLTSGLVEALKDEDPEVRWRAAWALVELNDARAVPVLISALKDRNEIGRKCALISLVAFGEKALAAVSEAYVRGHIEHEEAKIFYDELRDTLKKGFDKGTIAPPKSKPGDLDDRSRRMALARRMAKNGNATDAARKGRIANGRS
jgi:HEAT repeat protein